MERQAAAERESTAAPEATAVRVASTGGLTGGSPAALVRSVGRQAGNAAAARVARRLLQRVDAKPWETHPKEYVKKALTSPKRASFTKPEQSLEIGGRLCAGYADRNNLARTSFNYAVGMSGIRLTEDGSAYPFTMTFGGDFIDEVHEHNIELQGARVKDMYRVSGLIQQLQRAFTITIDTGPRFWDAADLDDLRTALELLTAREAQRLNGWTFRRVKDPPSGHGDADTNLQGHLVRVSDTIFPRVSVGSTGTKSDPGTVYGRPRAVHAILHEVGHVLDFTADEAGRGFLAAWTPHHTRLVAAGTRISSEPKGDPTAHPDFEVLAEAFARFKNDPAGLAAADAAVARFFTTNRHVP